MAIDVTYAKVSWTPGDVETLMPDWTEEQCEEWLAENDKRIADRMIERGWDVMADLLCADGYTPMHSWDCS